MREWERPPTDDELLALPLAAEAFRRQWASMTRPPFSAAFDGSPADVRALDYLDYEGFPLPPCGLEGAALVCGEVLRRAAGLHWVMSHRGDWFLATEECAVPGLAICPLARVQEIVFGWTPQFGRFAWAVARAALDCLRVADEAHAPAVLRLLDNDDEGPVPGIEASIERVRSASAGR
ncbi:MAG TPA: hypothetical protein VF796_16145 [Humisphaera sp.]